MIDLFQFVIQQNRDMSLSCPNCLSVFGPINTPKEACVLSCGDTYCINCINNLFLEVNEFQCLKCANIIKRELNIFPTNKLYYQSQVAFTEYLARLNWENPINFVKSAEIDRFNVDYDAKCMNPFCTKLKYRNETVNELFCSKQCKNLHQEMYGFP